MTIISNTNRRPIITFMPITEVGKLDCNQSYWMVPGTEECIYGETYSGRRTIGKRS